MDLCDQMLTNLRRIVRAIDLQSHVLVRRYGLTGPQMILLKELLRLGETSVSELARQINLSQATVTDMLNRLEKRGMIQRYKSDSDRRYVKVSLTNTALEQIDISTPLLQERFIEKFNAIDKWEQLQLLSSLYRIADMMQMEDIDLLNIVHDGEGVSLVNGKETHARGGIPYKVNRKENL